MPKASIRSRLAGPNVPGPERIASVAIGGALAWIGGRRRTWPGALIAAFGGALIARGVAARCPVLRARALRKGIVVRRAVTVQASPEQIYAMWREHDGLSPFLSEVELDEAVPGRRLRWHSLPGNELSHVGMLDLLRAPGDRGTIVDVRLRYRPHGGRLATGLASGWLRDAHGVQLAAELARLRMQLETGERATSAIRPDVEEAL